MSPYNWKREEIFKLIEMVEDRSCLWNVVSPDYHNQIKRRNCIAEIASALNIPAEKIKKKIHTLRAQYSKERSKLKLKKSGSGNDEIYQTKWEFFTALQFMFRHIKNTKTTNSMSIEVNPDVNLLENDSNDEQLAHQQPLATELDESSTHSSELSITTTDWPPIEPRSEILASATPRLRKRKTPDSSVELQEQTAINRWMPFLPSATPRDEFSIFGEYVSNELRLLGTAPAIQFKLKYDIQQLIIKAGLENALRRFGPSAASFSSTHNSASLLMSPPFSSKKVKKMSTPNSKKAESQRKDQRHSSPVRS